MLIVCSVPDKKAYWELPLNIIKGIGWNDKISTELRSEVAAEIT